ncbi:hypothetical protein EG329_004624 [Mollisiaceae sp. DMI_Dod_QoI]|nr:hypothetical protein EG329_004624 [Helotiales sp. DMI_Dod_QoI]
MNVNRTPGVYHTTSVELARAAHTTLARVAQKQTFDDYLNAQKDGNESRPVDLASRVEFRRPTVHHENTLAALTAGKIRDIVDRALGPSEYSQRRTLALTPTPTSNPVLDLSHPSYGLPKQLVTNLASLGIKSIYPWQSECLLRSGALGGQSNLVYTAPTGGDNPGKKAMLVLPYVALVQEKQRWLRKVVDGLVKTSASAHERSAVWRKRGDEDSIRVVGFYGGSKTKASWDEMDIAVCTIEKANALVNSAIEDLSIGKLSVVVMDELHMIDDENRGYILELMATKLLSLALDEKAQLIGMSATLNNADLLAKWLGAKFYISRYKPVSIEEYLVFDNAAYPASSSSRFYKTATQLSAHTQGVTSQARPQVSRLIEQSLDKELSNPLVNAVVSLANETARAGYGALVFCSSRIGCEKNAALISQVLPRTEEIDPVLVDKRRDVLNSLRSTTTGLDNLLEKNNSDAGLTTEERDIVATAYDEGVVKVIVATCSLAAGINLPARRVILHGARMGADLVGPSMLALLEIMATRLATSQESTDDYIKNTLLYHSIDHDHLADIVKSTIDELEESELVRKGPDAEYAATLLGQAIVASSLTPEDGLFVFRELRRALQAFVMDGEMHVLYLFTPVQAAQTNINWQIFSNEVERLDESNLRVLGFVGLKPLQIIKLAQGGSMKESTLEEVETARIYRRFYAALQLRDLCNEMPIHAVARKYDLPRGTIQNLAQACHGFAAGMIKFCERMNWGSLAAVLDHFSDRLKAGARADLLSLAKITYIKSRTARVFLENGFKSVAALAAADVNDILPILLMAQPKKPKLASHDEEKYLEKLKSKAAIILASASKTWELQMQQDLEEEELE